MKQKDRPGHWLGAVFALATALYAFHRDPDGVPRTGRLGSGRSAPMTVTLTAFDLAGVGGAPVVAAMAIRQEQK